MFIVYFSAIHIQVLFFLNYYTYYIICCIILVVPEGGGAQILEIFNSFDEHIKFTAEKKYVSIIFRYPSNKTGE